MADKACDLIGQLERDWRDALCAQDLDKLRQLIHPAFVLIATRGSAPFILDREEWLDAIQKRDVVTIELDVKEAVVFEQVIVGTIEARWKVKYLGRTIDDCVLLTDVWVCEDDRWQAVRRHSSPLESKDCVGA